MENIKSIIISLALMAIVVGGLVWFGSGKNQPANVSDSVSGGSLTADETFYDFGRISMKKGLVSHEFSLENKSGEAVVISEVFTSCMCTEAELEAGGKKAGPFGMAGHGFVKKAGLTVEPGEKLTVKAIFDPAAHGPAGIGIVERQISLNAGGRPVILGFKAEVAP